MRILHITNWYPNNWNPYEALFIKEHFSACSSYAEQQLWHIQVRNEGAWFKIMAGDYSSREHYLIIDTRIKLWRIRELLTFALLILLRIKLARKSWDIVNVHIAYPLLRFSGAVKLLFGRNLLITEHWSAFRQNFFLPAGSKAIQRIQGIFRVGTPVITVSQALMNDITSFAQTDSFPKFIIPNVVDQEFFYPNKEQNRNPAAVFLMAAS